MSFPSPSKQTMLLGMVVLLVLFSGCMGLGGDGQATETESETNDSSTLNVTADPNGGNTSVDETNSTSDNTTSTENVTETPTVNNTTESGDENDDGGVGDFISEFIGEEETGNTSIEENETKVEFQRNYANNVSVFVTSVGPAEHMYVVDSNGNDMYSTMSGSPSYSKSGISDEQFLVSGENGDEGTSVTVDVSGSGTVRVISVANGQEQTIATYDYDTDSESG